MAIIPTIVNFDITRIPYEGSPTFRADAGYVWSIIPSVIDSMNSAIKGQNTLSADVESAKTSASNSASSASESASKAAVIKNDVSDMKNDVTTMKEHIDGINNGINSAIAGAVESQIGDYTEQIIKNSTKLKMQNFGLNLI